MAKKKQSRGNAAQAAQQARKIIGKGKIGGQKRKGAGGAGKDAEVKKVAKKQDFWTEKSHLFPKRPKNFGIGQSLPPSRDLSRVVRWPKYIRIQRQRAILKKRLKVPPSINQFTECLDKNQATQLFKLMTKYRPETRKEKKHRLYVAAKNESEEKEKDPSKKPRMLKFGLKHITHLIEENKVRLVVIAHDVDPIEMVVWLPTLCRKKGIPYCIVKGKARLGAFVHQKTATALGFTEVHKKDQAQFEQLVKNFRAKYNDAAVFKEWGGKQMGQKTQKKQEKIARQRAAEIAQKQRAEV